MNLYDLTGDEDSPIYQELEISNGNRHYDFLRSIVQASLQAQRPFLSQTVIKSLNFHAITCLHSHAGEYRPCPVTVGEYTPPAHYQVQAMMDDFVNHVNRVWETSDIVGLATYVLWRVNSIHPFINGNGRTARAVSYFVLCVKAGKWLPGSPILPELLRQNRGEYIDALRHADSSIAGDAPYIDKLHDLVSRLLAEQLMSAGIDPSEDSL